MSRYQLYGRKNSGSLAVEVALNELGVPFDLVWVGTEPADLAEFRRVSPTGRVPALKLPDGAVVFESAAILIYLALAHPEAGLAPRPGSTQHAKFLQWMVFLSANAYEAVLRIYYPDRFSARGKEDAAAIRERGMVDLIKHFELIAVGLSPYVLGDEYSIADVYLYMLATWYPDGKAALYDRVPGLRLHTELLARRPVLATVEASHAT